MRIVFLIPDMRRDFLSRTGRRLRYSAIGRVMPQQRGLWTSTLFGGTLNIMRHCALARSLGADAVLATESGNDNYEDSGVAKPPTVRWTSRRRDDLCVVPDVYSHLVDEISGPVVVWQQNPMQVRRNFDHLRDNLWLWACSPAMVERCREILPGKEATFVPVIVDATAFPFIEQEQRESGLLAALPRKNAGPFIEAAYRRYREQGGRYWRLALIDGLPFHEFARRLRAPQAILPATDVEGCALPGLEAMAAGIVVAGKDARGSSFYMRDGDTALVADTPDLAAAALRRIEDPELRQQLARNGRRFVERFFPDAEPRRFWESFLLDFGRVESPLSGRP
jgi:hypothetical protein